MRAEFERGLVVKLRENNFDAVTSYDIVPEVSELDDPDFIGRMTAGEVLGVLMMRPAAVGQGYSLEAVRDQVSPETFRDIVAFAKEISSSDKVHLMAVVHMAIYMITLDEAILISAGATWLDEEVEDQAQVIERLQDLVVLNMNAARPAIREHLGLAPLEK